MVRYLYIAFLFYLPIVEMFVPPIDLGAGVPDLSIRRFFYYILLVIFIMEISKTKARIKDLSKWFAILCIFYLIVVASISWSHLYSFKSFSTIQAIVEKIFPPLFIAFLAHYVFSDEHNLDLYIKNICVCASILSLTSISTMILALTSGALFFRARAGGSLDNANDLAIFLVLTFPCILYGIENKIIPRVRGWMVTFSVVFGVISTVSRKGLVTMALTFFLIFFMKKQFKKIVVMTILFIALIPIYLGVTTFSHRWSGEKLQEQYEGKAVLVLAGWHMFKRSPLIGNGYKGYHRLFAEYFPRSRHARYSAHNIYITALANYGIMGFIPFMGIFLYPLYLSVKKLRRKDYQPEAKYSKEIAIICIASVLPFMISGWYAGGLFYQNEIIFLLYSQITFLFSSAILQKKTLDPKSFES